MTAMGCADVRELAPELATGAASGEQRAAAHAHLADCAPCRAEVSDLAQVVDALLVLPGGREPPAGFESAVLERLTPAPGRRDLHGWPAARAAAAAAAIVVGAAGLVVAHRSLTRSHGSSAPTALFAAPMRARDGRTVGRALASRDRPGWVLVDVRLGPERNETETYRVELVLSSGEVVRAGALDLREGRGSAAVRSPGTVAALRSVRVVTTSGRWQCEAVF